jgi:hypothetical protein
MERQARGEHGIGPLYLTLQILVQLVPARAGPTARPLAQDAVVVGRKGGAGRLWPLGSASGPRRARITSDAIGTLGHEPLLRDTAQDPEHVERARRRAVF